MEEGEYEVEMLRVGEVRLWIMLAMVKVVY